LFFFLFIFSFLAFLGFLIPVKLKTTTLDLQVSRHGEFFLSDYAVSLCKELGSLNSSLHPPPYHHSLNFIPETITPFPPCFHLIVVHPTGALMKKII